MCIGSMEIAEELISAIHRVPSRATDTSSRTWTAAVKAEFAALGQAQGWLVCTSAKDPGVEPEWLFDLTWYQRHEDQRLELGLVLES